MLFKQWCGFHAKHPRIFKLTPFHHDQQRDQQRGVVVHREGFFFVSGLAGHCAHRGGLRLFIRNRAWRFRWLVH